MYRNGNVIVCETMEQRLKAQRTIAEANMTSRVFGIGGVNIVCSSAEAAEDLLNIINKQKEQPHAGQ